MNSAGSDRQDVGRADIGVPKIPDHEVVRRIGAGSHGEVWLARTVTGVWRAVKVVRGGLFRDGRPYAREFAGLQRFEPLSRDDEGFVDVLHTGRNDVDGYFYYVMELADDAGASGFDPATYQPQTLSRVLSNTPRLPVPMVLTVGRQLASALGRLHREGLIHRDVKPSNIVFVCGQPKLADIGLVVEESEARSYVGTDGYIPPEGPNSRQADLFSLGMVLYEICMGRPRRDFPAPAEEMDGGEDAEALRELNAVILKACASHPRHRYATAEALLEDLAWIESGGSVRRRQRWRRWRRRGLQALAGAAALVFLAVAWDWRRAVWWESGRQARLDEHEQRVAELHAASAARALNEGDDAMALLWLAHAISAREVRGETRVPERVLVRQLRDRLPEPRAAIPAGSGLFSVSYSPEGDRVVTSDDRGRACIWSSMSGQLLHGPTPCANRPVHVQVLDHGLRAWAAPRIEMPAFIQPSEAIGRVNWVDLATGKVMGVPWEGVGWAVDSPDHRWLAAAESGFRVGLGRADGEGGRIRLEGHSGPLESLTFSPESDLLFSGSYDGTVRVWRVPGGQPVGSPIRVAGRLKALAVGPGSRMLVTLSEDESRRRILQWWDRVAGVERLERRIVGAGMAVLDGRVARGQKVLVNGDSGDFAVRNIADGSPCFPDLSLGGGRCRSWDLGPGGLHLLMGGGDGHVQMWDLENGQVFASPPRHPRAVRWVGFHPSDGSWFTAAEDGLVRVWNGPKNAKKWGSLSVDGEWRPPNREARTWEWQGAAWNAKGDTLLALAHRGGSDMIVALSVTTGDWMPVVRNLDVSSSASLVGSGEEEAWAVSGVVPANGPLPSHAEDVLWITRAEGQWHQRRLPHPATVANLRLDSRGQVVTIDVRGTARRWNAAAGRVEHFANLTLASSGPYLISEGGAYVADLDPTSRRVRVRSWEQRGAEPMEIPLDTAVAGIRFFGRAPMVASTHPESQPMVWDVRRGLRLSVDAAGFGRCRIADWNERDQRLLTCPELGLPTVVDLASGVRRRMGVAESGQITYRTGFSQDGRWVITQDAQNRIQVHDAVSGQAVTPALVHSLPVWWAGIGQAQILVTLSGTNTVRRWSLEPDRTPAPVLLRIAEATSARRLDNKARESWMDPMQATEHFAKAGLQGRRAAGSD